MTCRPRIVRLRVHRGGLACNSRLRESQINKLSRRSGPDEGQPDNRKFNEPSAMRQTQFNSCAPELKSKYNKPELTSKPNVMVRLPNQH